jgi:hypothetical protein
MEEAGSGHSWRIVSEVGGQVECHEGLVGRCQDKRTCPTKCWDESGYIYYSLIAKAKRNFCSSV